MRKFSTLAAIAVAAIGLTTVSAGSAFAMGCLNTDLPPISLSHDDMVPGAGFGYNRDAYLAAQAKGNTCGTTQQSYSTDRDRFQSNPNVSKAPQTRNSVVY